MYFFYLIESVGGRAGFGICQDFKERNKQYVSHSGDIVKFKYLYGGIRGHAKDLERLIKIQYVDNLWQLEDWKTEWLNDLVKMPQLQEYVDSLLKERPFLRLKLVAQDYDCTQDLEIVDKTK